MAAFDPDTGPRTFTLRELAALAADVGDLEGDGRGTALAAPGALPPTRCGIRVGATGR